MQMEERLRKRKTETKTQLPEDIIHDEILPRLPFKYLQRFRCVCKPWRSLFSDAKFFKLRLSRQHDENYVMKRSYSYESEIEIISRSKQTRIDKPTFIRDSLSIGSINGLICFLRPARFTLWNPAIGQYKELSTTQLHTTNCKKSVDWNTWSGTTKGHLYGFGWDPSRNEYKMVIVCYQRPDLRHGFVYSCSSDSWTQLVLPTAIFGIKIRYYKSPYPTTIVKECPYWSYSKYLTVPGKIRKRRCTVVFKFVAENNEFRSLPDFLSAQQELKLINLKDSLVGMTYKKEYPFALDRVMNIYSLDHEGSAGVWSKLYTLQATEFDQRGFPNQFSCYDPKRKEIKGVVDGAPFKIEHFAYTPSLLFVPGMKDVMHSETYCFNIIIL